MKNRMILIVTALVFFSGVIAAQPSLQVSIHIPTISVDPAAESYLPDPIPVTVTIYNTGTVASQSLSARISFPPDLQLDDSEQHAMIKAPQPAVVQPNDSVKVTWMLTHPVSFTTTNYRVRIWLTHTPADSFETQKLFILPPMEPPDFKLAFITLPKLTVRPDSLGYDNNPFSVFFRLVNQGGTSMDSVQVHLHLPEDYILDPMTQNNPLVYDQVMPPPQVGMPRIEMEWLVRYVGATIHPREDTLHLVATGRDALGGLVRKDTTLLVQVEGISPRYTLRYLDPGAMQYDAQAIYSPQPYPLRLRIENISEQWIDLSTVALTVNGEGVTTADPLQETIPMIPAGGHIEYQWRMHAERRSVPRQFTAMAEVADLHGRRESAIRTVSVPGQPFALNLEHIQLPDTLHTNAEGTALLNTTIPISFMLRNDTWYNNTVTHSRIHGTGMGILPPPFKERQHAFDLTPGAISQAIEDTFFVQEMIDDRVVTIQITAVSDREDTARSSRSVFVPGLRPLLRMLHSGPERILADGMGGYVPNPMGHEYVLHNDGNVELRIDSVVLRYHMDGVSTPEALRRDYGWFLRPGDSLLTRWNFSVYERDSSRVIPMHVTAYLSGRFEADISNHLYIDALAPEVDAIVSGPDTLAIDPDALYAPNPFVKQLRIRNTGNADLHVDRVQLAVADPLIDALDPLEWTDGRLLPPDSAMTLSWRLEAREHAQATDAEMIFTVYHSGGTGEAVVSTVHIPARVPGLEARISGDAQLLFDETTVYHPSPFLKRVQLRNTGTADLLVDSVIVSWTDPQLRSVEPALRVLNSVIAPGREQIEEWHFHASPHASSGYVTVRFTIYHDGGNALPLTTDVFIPGQPYAVHLRDVVIPDRVTSRTDGQGYEPNPVVVHYQVENDTWFDLVLGSVRVEATGEGVQLLSPQPRPGEIRLLAGHSSSRLYDSLFVLPASMERSIRVTVSVEAAYGMHDEHHADIYIPVSTTHVADGRERPQNFVLHGIYPNPVSLATAQRMYLDMESVSSLQVSLHDRLGRRIMQYDDIPALFTRSAVALTIPELDTGLYYIRITGRDVQHVHPLVLYR
ncbi:MAG: T9SS type A sorting domain-containing protein [Bacteroidetes bacterium]|nr:T9SS type A sorting domain-containing protein [Bacteroidota bacterium]